ncbi:MAG: glycogen phosphorylase, partial [Acetobacteraceae bacterium]
MSAPAAVRTDPPSLPSLPEIADAGVWREAIHAKLTYEVGKSLVTASDRDWFIATALAVRDRIVARWITSTRETYRESRKRVYYLSLEFLIGRLLMD